MQVSGGHLLSPVQTLVTTLIFAASENAYQVPLAPQRITVTLIQVAVIFFLWYYEEKGGDWMNLVQEYLELANDVVLFDEYDNKDAVKEYNRKATRMRKIATEIEANHPTLKNAFCKMLFHENAGIRIGVAHHVLEVMNCDKSYRKAALKEIRYKARTDKTANGFGEKVWLKEWYKNYPKDRWI